jgi:HK97 family phage prohead protease
MIYKTIQVDSKSIDSDNRTITVIGSNESVDRDGDIIKANGIDTKNFKNNPVILFGHNHRDLPIAKGIGRKAWVDDNKLMFKIQFPTEEEYAFADTVFKLYKGGYMNAFSIGFLPDFNAIEHTDEKTYRKTGARRIFNKAELLELSAVPVPANATALVASFNKAWESGDIDGDELKELEEFVEGYKMSEVEDIENKQVDEPNELELLKQEIIELKQKIVDIEKTKEIQVDVFDGYLNELFKEFDPDVASGANELPKDDLNNSDDEEEKTFDEYINEMLGDK